jgi:hypothetical protein
VKTMCRVLRIVCLAACLLVVGPSALATAMPSLSVSFVGPSSVRISWPTNYTIASWQLSHTVSLIPADWQPVSQTPVLASDTFAVVIPITDASGYFRLQQNGGGSGACVFQATPGVIQAGASTVLTWCPQAGTTYNLTPGPGAVTGGSATVSPTVTTVYTLTANDASGVTNLYAAVVVNPCGWLQVASWDVGLGFYYDRELTTSAYIFKVHHLALPTFHLTRQPGSTATDARYFGLATGGGASMNDLEVDKGPPSFTTTEVGSGPIPLNVSYFSLHVTCSSYDFSYSVIMNTTETSQFGVTTSFDGAGTGAISSLPLPTQVAKFSDHDEGVTEVPAQYPPSGAQYYIPDSDLGKAMFSTGVANSSNAGTAALAWEITPVP